MITKALMTMMVVCLSSILSGCSHAGVELMACGKTEKLALPRGWTIQSVQEPFSSAATALEERFPTGPKAKIRFTHQAEGWVELYVTAVLWMPQDIKQYKEDVVRRIDYAMALPFYVGQSNKFRFMYLQGNHAEELLGAIHSLSGER